MNKKKKTILYLIAITILSIFLSVIIVRLVKDPQTYIETINKKHLSIVISYIILSITQTIIPIVSCVIAYPLRRDLYFVL